MALEKGCFANSKGGAFRHSGGNLST